MNGNKQSKNKKKTTKINKLMKMCNNIYLN